MLRHLPAIIITIIIAMLVVDHLASPPIQAVSMPASSACAPCGAPCD